MTFLGEDGRGMQVAFIDKLALSLLWDAFQQERYGNLSRMPDADFCIKKNIAYHLKREGE
jgi:hypothetical protein